MICDLHTHSIYSDGTSTPQELIDKAIDAKIAAIALTDHNTVDGLPSFVSAANGKNIDIILGSEFSTDYKGKELHILALFIDPKHFEAISKLMDDVIIRKEKSYIDLIGSLSQAGFELNYEEIKAKTPNGKINRAHIATEMMKKDYVSSVAEAFESYLSKSGGYYKEAERIDVFNMLDFINSIGAVSVLAHPFLNLSEEMLIEFLPLAKQHGLVGMECYYSLNDEQITKRSLQLIKKFELLPSGGSDFHGARKPDIELGIGKGNLKIPYEWYKALKEKAE